MCKSVFRNLMGDYFFWAILLLFLGINIYSICDLAGKRNEETIGHEKVYAEFKGELSEEKIFKVVERYKELSEIVATDNYSHEGNQPGTYTGYIAGDYGEFEEIFNEYKYRYEYAAFAKEIIAKPTATNRIKEVFAGRKLDSYYDMEGPKEWMEYDFYTLLCVALTTFCACKIVVYNKKQNIYILLETCSLGIRKVMARKIGALILMIFIIVSMFSVLNMCIFWWHYDMEGIHESLYAIEEYKTTLFSGTVFQYWLVQTLGVCIACSLIGIISMFFAMVVKEELYAMLLGVLIYIIFIGLFFRVICWGNPVGLLAGANLIKDMDLYWHVFGTILGLDFWCASGLIWVSGKYRVSIHG